VQGVDVEQCGLCDHVQGAADAVGMVAERREAKESGHDPAVYPLVKAMDEVPTFQVVSASAGRGETSEYPYVFFRVRGDGLRDVERLLTSLEMANQATQRRWVVECSLQRGLLFILRPRFWKPVLEIDERDIREARADLELLAEVLTRDRQLSWGRE
jgi:hypothetical protein